MNAFIDVYISSDFAFDILSQFNSEMCWFVVTIHQGQHKYLTSTYKMYNRIKKNKGFESMIAGYIRRRHQVNVEESLYCVP